MRPATHAHRNHLLLTDHASALLQVSDMWMDSLLVAAMVLYSFTHGSGSTPSSGTGPSAPFTDIRGPSLTSKGPFN